MLNRDFSAGFYKANEEKNRLFYAPSAIYAPTYTLIATEKDAYEYPVDGWTWYETKAEALIAEAVTEPPAPAKDETGRRLPRAKENRNAIVQE